MERNEARVLQRDTPPDYRSTFEDSGATDDLTSSRNDTYPHWLQWSLPILSPSGSHRRTLRFKLLVLAFLGITCYIAYTQVSNRDAHTPHRPNHKAQGLDESDILGRRKPKGFKIIGLIFFGRRQYTDILDCYLRKNLAVNDGFLDEVHFILNTDVQEDTQWLDWLIEKDDLQDYYKVLNRELKHKGDFDKLWKFADSKRHMYIKLDDDVVWIHDDAIPRLVHTLIAHPEAHSIQGNIINSYRTFWLHFHTDAVHPFLPETHPISGRREESNWRPSKLPKYKGKPPPKTNFGPKMTPEGHRWLPLEDTAKNLWPGTPIAKVKAPDTKGLMLYDWTVGAQEHYSLLQNIENDKLNLYWAGNGEGIFNMWYSHFNINLMAIWGRTLIDHPIYNFIWGGDEWALTEKVPKSLGMPVKIDTHALAAHFSFHPQVEGMTRTDLLDRYRTLANEFTCAVDNIKKAF